MRVFDRKNCENKVRKTKRINNTVFTLMGKHSYEWEVAQENNMGIIVTTFNNRVAATKFYNNLIK